MSSVWNCVRHTRTVVAALVFSLALGACATDGKRDPLERPKNPFKSGGDRELPVRPQVSERELKAEAGQLYRVARRSLDTSDFADASQRYEILIERYPFTEFATQGELERIYAMQREYKPDEALSAAERFLREHPRYAHADYAQYLKGIIQAERDKGLLDALPGDNSKQDETSLRRAYDEFSLLLQKYPTSHYAEDARARMIDLRNRIARHDLHVVRYYVKRGAHLAAAKRAEQLIAQYPGAPATLDALRLLVQSYRELGLSQQAEDAAKLLAAQNPIANAATPGAYAAPQALVVSEQGGWFSRFAGLFSFLDFSKKAPVEIVIPSTDAPAKSATGGVTDAPAEANPNRLIIGIDTGEDEAPAKPAETTRPDETPAPPAK